MSRQQALDPIDESTPVSSFPSIYNEDINELKRMIVDLQQQLTNKNQEITTLKNNFNAALNTLRAEYTRMIDDLKNKIEDNQ